MNETLAVVAITKNGIKIAKKIKDAINIINKNADVYAPEKLKEDLDGIFWFKENTSDKIGFLFKEYKSLICIFSLGAVIRLITPHIKDKRTDPAILVIDDKANFVISVLSGHLGGANDLANEIAKILNSTPVITTAADVNNTLAVDMIGKKFGWVIENTHNITKVSAMMVNEEKIGFYQDAGENNWNPLLKLPSNVTQVDKLELLDNIELKGCIIITDKLIVNEIILKKAVIYRPKCLVVGVGLHWDTSSEIIEKGIKTVFENHALSFNSIRNIASIDKERKVKGLQQFSEKYNIPIETYDKNELSSVNVPNPSVIVKRYEGTSSVSEASSLISSRGDLIVTKQKFPPNLTIAVSKVKYN